jgi:hypothetical protein
MYLKWYSQVELDTWTSNILPLIAAGLAFAAISDPTASSHVSQMSSMAWVVAGRCCFNKSSITVPMGMKSGRFFFEKVIDFQVFIVIHSSRIGSTLFPIHTMIMADIHHWIQGHGP